MQKWISFALAMLVCLLPLGALAETASQEPEQTDMPAETSAPVPEKSAPLKLLNELWSGQNALVYSPLSLSVALGMAAEGAAGETREQIDTFLGERRPDWAVLEDLSFSGVKIGNATFYRPEFVMKDSYVEALQNKYDAAPVPMEIGAVVPQVNQWVSEKTDNLIDGLLSEEPEDNTMLLLINALSMKMEWVYPFNANSTAPDFFHAPMGDVEVSMMHLLESLDYAETEEIQAVTLPYRDSDLCMTVVMPKDGNLDKLVETVSAAPDEFLADVSNRSQQTQVDLALPNVQAESSLELVTALQAAGISDAFDPANADFTGMADNSSEEGLYIGDVLQKAVLKVNENGTEAAAVTSVIMEARGVLPIDEAVHMTVDRPFMMLVHDPISGFVLFAACINNPA